MGSIPGLGRSHVEGNSNPLENSMDRGGWQATVHGITESNMTEQLSTHAREVLSSSLTLRHITSTIAYKRYPPLLSKSA